TVVSYKQISEELYQVNIPIVALQFHGRKSDGRVLREDFWFVWYIRGSHTTGRLLIGYASSIFITMVSIDANFAATVLEETKLSSLVFDASCLIDRDRVLQVAHTELVGHQMF